VQNVSRLLPSRNYSLDVVVAEVPAHAQAGQLNFFLGKLFRSGLIESLSDQNCHRQFIAD
jgi:hypothetical protein